MITKPEGSGPPDTLPSQTPFTRTTRYASSPGIATLGIFGIRILLSSIEYSSFKNRFRFVYFQSSCLIVGNPDSRKFSQADCRARRRSALSTLAASDAERLVYPL